MGDISKLNVGGTLYDIKDAKARTDVSDLKEEFNEFCTKTLLNGYDKDDVQETKGYWSNSDGAFVASNNYYACNKYAEVKPNTAYSSWYSAGSDSRYTYVCFYDSQKTFISGSVLANSNIITSPANAKYVRVSAVVERTDTYVFCEGSTYNGYHSFGEEKSINDDVVIDAVVNIQEKLAIFEYTTSDSDGYMNFYGDIDTTQTAFKSKTTNNIICTEGDVFSYTGVGQWGAYSYMIYDNSGSVIARGQINGSDSITIPQNGVAIKLSSFVAKDSGADVTLIVKKLNPLTLADTVYKNEEDIEKLKEGGTQLDGVKIDIIGDSWSAVNDTASVKYTDLLASRDGALINVIAYSGSGYSTPTSANKPFYVQAQSVRTDADIVFIFGSFNDMVALTGGVTIGDVTDSGTTTMCGCINTTIDNILARNPSAKILVATSGAWQGYNANGDGNNPNNALALQYIEAVKNVCFKRGYECKDMLRCMNLKPWIADFRTAYQPDGCHPNNAGHLKYLYPIIKNYLSTVV